MDQCVLDTVCGPWVLSVDNSDSLLPQTFLCPVLECDISGWPFVLVLSGLRLRGASQSC